jgi:hypothetical protein
MCLKSRMCAPKQPSVADTCSRRQASDAAFNNATAPRQLPALNINTYYSIPDGRGHDRGINLTESWYPASGEARHTSVRQERTASMADTPVSPVKESATTREEMDFDDSSPHEQETGRVSPLGTETQTPAATTAKSPSPRPRVSFQEGHEEIPPNKPPRPMSPQQQAENTLIEAFPSIDTKVVKAVLAASGGKVEPAFNALLGMSDPDFRPEEAPPQPPRPALKQQTPQSQMEADEMYARQLAEQYNSGSAPRGQAQYNQRQWSGGRGPNQQRPQYDEDDRERSFFDDDLPEIGKNIQQGFVETQKKFNSWINNFRKRIDGDEEDEDLYTSSQPGSRQNTDGWSGQQQRQNFGPSQSEQMYGIRRQAEAQQARQSREGRRSTEAGRYDADPHELGDDEFERLELRDDDDSQPPPMPPRTSSRKSANPDLFKSRPKPPQSGAVDEVEAAERKSTDGGKAKKWQPLTSVAPAPEEDNDPFSLGDDEEDAGHKSEEVRKEDTERLKKQASESVSAGEAGDAKKVLQESEKSGRSGSINAEAAELLGGKKE